MIKDIEKLRLLRGTTSGNEDYTGEDGEVTVDSDAKSLRLHDGTKSGGFVVGSTLTNSVSGTSIELSFISNKTYEINLTSNTTITLVDRKEGVLNELLVKINGLDDNTVTWPVDIMWLKPDGSYTSDSSQMGFPFSSSDWIVFWSHGDTGDIIAKVMR